MLREPAPRSFEGSLKTIEVSTEDMWRFSRFPMTEPFWAAAGRHRFDDARVASGGIAAFGVLYVGYVPEVAFAESVIHENSAFNPKTGRFEVSSTVLRERSLVSFRHATKSHLRMVDLTGTALKALGLNNDLCAGCDHGISQRWSTAIHAARPDLDGLRFTSRQLNTSFCYAVFSRSGLLVDDHEAMPDDVLDALCARFNIVPI
jgi:hypothetical protein